MDREAVEDRSRPRPYGAQRSAILLLAWLGLCVPEIAAQEVPETSTSVQARLLQELADRARVRLRVAERPDPVEGTLVGVDASVASIAGDGEVVRVALDGVEEIRVWESKARQGALIGGTLGLGAGLLVGWGLVGVGWADSGGEGIAGLALSGLLGTIAGGAVGSLIGATASDWERIFPASEQDVP